MALNTSKIKGVNLGSWLLMEGYILGGRNIAESTFKECFRKANGRKDLLEFERCFRDTYIQEEDFVNIAATGATAVRLPFNARLIETGPFRYSQENFIYLDNAFKWAARHNIGIILDLHAAPGAQNGDWHADCPDGKALFWENPRYQDRACALWETIVDRFKDEPMLIGYDVLNEPVIGDKPTNIVRKFYQNAVRRIQAIDQKHLLFLEGDIWAQRIDYLKDFISSNVRISIHAYLPLNYTFNFTPFYRFPGVIDGENWDEGKVRKYLEPYAQFSRDNHTKLFVGEFGINWRGGVWGEVEWLKTILGLFDEYGFDYTYWTYKAIANHVFPDGLYQALPNSKFICRQGPIFGCETYGGLWKNEKAQLIDFWRTKNFTPNQALLDTLSAAFRRG